MQALALLLLAAAPETSAPAVIVTPEAVTLVVLDLTSADDITPGLSKTISDAVAVQLQQQRIVDRVYSQADLRALLDVEASKKVFEVPCDDEACRAEIAEALGATILVHGRLNRLGSIYAVTLTLFDARAGRAIAREKTETESIELLPRRVEHASRRLALEYQGKNPDLAGDAPTDGARSAVLWTGVGISALGAATLATGVGFLLSSGATLEDPDSSGNAKDVAQDAQPIVATIALVGALGTLAGGATAAASFWME